LGCVHSLRRMTDCGHHSFARKTDELFRRAPVRQQRGIHYRPAICGVGGLANAVPLPPRDDGALIMLDRLLGYRLISPAVLRASLGDTDLKVFDVNSVQSWQRARVPQARHLDPQRFVRADLPADMQTRLLFYCSNFFCAKAPQAARRARAMGFENVFVLATGISGWLAAGAPIHESGDEGKQCGIQPSDTTGDSP